MYRSGIIIVYNGLDTHRPNMVYNTALKMVIKITKR